MRKSQKAPAGWFSFIRMLANDSKLKFAVGSPATDGQTVWLPELPAELHEEDLILFKGDAFHEVGHIRHSNIPFFQAFSAQHGQFGQFLLNAIDDVFMEGRMSAWKVMASRYLRESTNVLIKRGTFRDGSANLAEAVGCFCLSYLTAKRWPETGAAMSIIEANMRKHLAEHADLVVPKLVALLDAEFPAVRSTEHGGDLVLKIMELLNQLAEQEQSDEKADPDNGNGDPSKDDAEGSDKSDSSNPDGSNDDESNGANGAGGSEKSDDSKDPESKPQGEGKGEDDGKSGSGSESKGEGQGKGEGESQAGNQGAKAGGKSLKEMVDEMLKENLGNQEVFDKGQAVKELSDKVRAGTHEDYKGQPLVSGLVIEGVPAAGSVQDFVEGMPVIKGDREMASVIESTTGRKAGVMANKLRALLLNREETESYSTRNGRLNEKNLYRIGMHDSRIFEKQDERVEETAAVSITADLSGSTMRKDSGTSIAEQIRIALSLLEKVLNEIGTPREILGFAPSSGELNCVVRTFRDNHRVALDRIAGLHRHVGGSSTPIGEAVLQAGSRLMGHDAQRKLLFVLTDGSPSSEERATEMTSLITRGGVQVIYLVIGDIRSCKWLVDNKLQFAHASKAEDLIPAIVAKVGEFLS